MNGYHYVVYKNDMPDSYGFSKTKAGLDKIIKLMGLCGAEVRCVDITTWRRIRRSIKVRDYKAWERYFMIYKSGDNNERNATCEL
jgi:hypothetical protein